MIAWVVAADLGVMWLLAVRKWYHWQGEAAEWRARAEVRGETIDNLYDELRTSARNGPAKRRNA